VWEKTSSPEKKILCRQTSLFKKQEYFIKMDAADKKKLSAGSKTPAAGTPKASCRQEKDRKKQHIANPNATFSYR
jgi:hypothetical protein